jgi:anti-sigma factor RsiW
MRPDDDADALLSDALDRVPRRRAPERLLRSLDAKWGGGRAPKSATRLVPLFAAALVGAAIAASVLLGTGRTRAPSGAMVTEAVNDHLRVLYGEHPLEVESGGVHQVKPWFAGRLDFAPVVAFGGDDEFPLQGGAVAYFVDRKAAAYEYKRRLHPITLFVVRADGLSWPAPSKPIGRARAATAIERGFHVLLWRDGDLGYALVSDVDEGELSTLAARIAGP